MAKTRLWIPGNWLAAIVAAIAVATLYAAASWSNQFVYDDLEVIQNQYPLRSFSDVAQIFREPHYLNFPYYRPITRLTLAAQHTIWPDDPRPFHLFNAILAGVLLLSVYALLLRPGWMLNPSAALLAAIWLCAHPAISECVYPAASGRETLMPAVMIVLAMWAYLRPDRIGFWLAMAFFGLALLCKEQAVVLPVMFFLADILGITRSGVRHPLHWKLRYLTIFVITAAYFLLRHHLFQNAPLRLDIQNDPWGPALSMLYGLQTAIAPYLALHYEPSLAAWLDWRLYGIAGVVLIILIVLVWQSSRAVKLVAVFWLGWFVLLQLPTAHIFAQEAAYSERYAALAVLAPAGAAAAVLSERLRSRSARWFAGFIAFGWTALLAWASFLRGSYYLDNTSFCIQWANTDPNAAGAHRGLGFVAQQQGNMATAISEYQQTLALSPNDRSALNNLANIFAQRQDFLNAAHYYEHSLRLDPNDAEVLVNYANMLAEFAIEHRDPAARDKAHDMLAAAIQRRPRYPQAHFAMGLWHQAFGPHDAAIEDFKIALSLRPGWTEAQDHLNRLLEAQTRP